MKTLALSLALLAGCSGMNDIGTMPPEAVDKAIEAWQDRGLPWNDRCYDQQPTIQVVVTYTPCPRSHAEACFVYTEHGQIPTIFVADKTEREPSYIWQHELKHWLAMCTGLDHTGDPGHGNCQIWPELCSAP